MSVLCLIANPANPVLTSELMQTLHRTIGGEINWLHNEIACEIINPDAPDVVGIDRSAVEDMPVDIALVPQLERRKKLLFADMDSTMIEQECIDEMADALGIKPEIAAITQAAMRGELDFQQALKQRVALLKGISLQQIREIRRQNITLAAGGFDHG